MDKQLATNFVISQFLNLESQLEDCLNFVPYISQNKQLVSPKFVPILMESCSLIDSILRHYSGSGKKGNIKVFQELCEPDLRLSAKITLFLNTPIVLLGPFSDWRNTTPAWWSAYNEIKHDRINSMASATFEHTISALAALHQTISSYAIFLGALLRLGWINTADEDVLVSLAGNAHVFTSPRYPSMAIESRFFVSPTHENFINDGSDPEPNYLDIDYGFTNLSERAKNFVMAHEDY